jgi:sulfite reductase (ferredoxin)
MALDPQSLRLEGVYQQNDGRYMQRIKLAGGLISAEQAEKVASIADQLADGMVHLTTRGSLELHGLAAEELPGVARQLAAVGLTSRGACGGAARCISCSTSFAPGYPLVQVLAGKLHHHFTQNPHFEGLPKKFKIGVEAGYSGARHLIQDVGLVLTTEGDAAPCFDVWVAGGLGKEPQPAFLLASQVPEEQLIPLIEDIIALYKEHAPKGRRLKHLIREIGQDGFRALLSRHRSAITATPLLDGFAKALTHGMPPAETIKLEASVFAGQLPTPALRGLARIAHEYAAGFLVMTTDQNVVFFTQGVGQATQAAKSLTSLGFSGTTPEECVTFRICPGSHECRMGLAPTRDLARQMIAAMGPAARHLSWAISGCHNSCSQPQLADIGLFAARLTKSADGTHTPLFNLLRRNAPDAFGQLAGELLAFGDVLDRIRQLG